MTVKEIMNGKVRAAMTYRSFCWALQSCHRFHADHGPAPVCVHDEGTGTPLLTRADERKPWPEKSRDAVSVTAIGLIALSMGVLMIPRSG